MLDKILKVFKIHFSAQAKLEDGTELYIDGDIAKGAKCFVVTPDGNIPIPDGNYPLDDGNVITCKDGIIENIVEKPVGETPPVEAPVKQEVEAAKNVTKVEQEKETEKVEEEGKKIKKTEEKVVKLEEQLKNLTDLLEIKSAQIEKLNSDFNNFTEKTTIVKEVKKNQVEEVKDVNSKIQLISEMRNKK